MTSATTALIKEDAQSVEEQESVTHFIVKNVYNKKKTEMGAPKLSTLEAQKPIYFMNGKSTDSKKGEVLRNLTPLKNKILFVTVLVYVIEKFSEINNNIFT